MTVPELFRVPTRGLFRGFPKLPPKKKYMGGSDQGTWLFFHGLGLPHLMLGVGGHTASRREHMPGRPASQAARPPAKGAAASKAEERQRGVRGGEKERAPLNGGLGGREGEDTL